MELWQGRCSAGTRLGLRPFGSSQARDSSLKPRLAPGSIRNRPTSASPGQRPTRTRDLPTSTSLEQRAIRTGAFPTSASLGQHPIRTGALPTSASSRQCCCQGTTRAARRMLHKKEDLRPPSLLPISFGSRSKDLPSEPLLFVSHFSHPRPPVALRRLGRAGRVAGEPGPASGVAAPRAQRGPGRGGRPPAPEAVSEPAHGSPAAAL